MKKILFVVLFVCACICVNAQESKGDFAPLVGQKQINVVFFYEGVTYDGDSEDKFLKNESDRDDFEEWKSKWVGSFRTEMWEPKFIEELNDEMEDTHISLGNYPQAEYTIIIKMVDIDPGSIAGPFSVPCKLTADASFVKTGATESFATISFDKLPGNYFVMTPIIEHRVKFAFDELGKTMGEILNKIIK